MDRTLHVNAQANGRWLAIVLPDGSPIAEIDTERQARDLMAALGIEHMAYAPGSRFLPAEHASNDRPG